MIKITLDTNCIIDLEENRPNAVHIRKLIDAWRIGHIQLAVVAVSASENQRGGSANSDFSLFEQKLEGVGLAGVQHLLPLGKWDVSYWGHCLYSDDAMEQLESDIRVILFPNIQETPPSIVAEKSVWRNHLCDVLVAWSHVFHGWDYLVTSDNNFHRHKEDLKRVGLNNVVRPRDAVNLCSKECTREGSDL